jgi:transcriptional regulator with XRE-family HTH domain
MKRPMESNTEPDPAQAPGRTAPGDQHRAARAPDAADEIGVRVTAHRLSRQLRVTELARAAGISPSLLSQIEKGRSRPSVSTLFAIAEALRVPVDSFFRTGPVTAGNPAGTAAPAPGDPGDPAGSAASAATGTAQADGYLVRRADRAVIDIEGGVRWERLTPGPLDNVEFLELVYAPGAESSPALYRHPGQEMIMVLSGRLDIYVGFERYQVEAGDSMHFPSMVPHRYVNPTSAVTRAVTAIIRS